MTTRHILISCCAIFMTIHTTGCDSDSSETPAPSATADVTMADTLAPETNDNGFEDGQDNPEVGDVGPAEPDDATAQTDVESETIADPGDVATDTGPDDTPDFEMPADASAIVQIKCPEFCENYALNCGAMGEMTPEKGNCLENCVTKAMDNENWLINYMCLPELCGWDACKMDEGPAPINPLCMEGCGLFESCGMLAIVEVPDDMPELCAYDCSFSMDFLEDGLPEEMVQCVIGELSDDCNPAAVELCAGEMGGGPEDSTFPGCHEVCTNMLSPEQGFCAPWNTIYQTFPTTQSCIDTCTQTGDLTAQQIFTACLMGLWCHDAAACLMTPESIDPACEAACMASATACIAEGGDVIPLNECGPYCSGQAAMLGGISETAMECAEGIDTCGEGGDPFVQVLQCATDLEDECQIICDALTPCWTTEDGMPEPFVAECTSMCQMGVLGPLGLANVPIIAECLANTGDNCAAKEGCLEGGAVPLCYQMCGYGACDAESVECVSECQATLGEANSEGLAQTVCELVDTCTGSDICDNIPMDTPPAGCEQSCLLPQFENVCIDHPGGCVAACAGALTAAGNQGPAAASCALEYLGSSCSTMGLKDACM